MARTGAGGGLTPGGSEPSVSASAPRKEELPHWLLRRLEFDVLITTALLDAAALKVQPMGVGVVSDLRRSLFQSLSRDVIAHQHTDIVEFCARMG